MTTELSRTRSRARELLRYLLDDRWNMLFPALALIAFLGWVATWIVFGSMKAAGGALSGFWGLTEPISGLATLLAVFASWYVTLCKSMENEGEVRIVIKFGDQEVEIPYRPLRRNLNRGELAGILGFYYGSPRYDPKMVVNAIEHRGVADSPLTRVLRGREDVLVIEIDDPAEFKKFSAQIQASGPPSPITAAPTPPVAEE
jgi:hypothetical protein